MKVLLVDDEVVSLQFAEYTLRQAGYEVTMARDGQEALGILAGGQYHLVVADWNMPRMDGTELCRDIRSGRFSDYIYFILLTGKTGPEETLEGLRAGADDYIHKPYNPTELIMRCAIGSRIIGMAHAASRAKTEFLANMSHEIRTPMTAILGYADLLADENVESARQEYIAVIKRNGKHLIGMINDILDLSKIEAGTLKIEPIRCSPAQLAAEVASLMRPQAAAKQLNLKTELVQPLPETVLTDPLRLRQVLVNLLSNAIKFTEQGEVVFAVRQISHSNSPRLCFDVIDTGIGLSEEQLGKLFKPFNQADNSSTRKYGGTGLGLCISKRLAEALGGDIEVRSEPGRGCTFSVIIDMSTPEGMRTVLENKEPAIQLTPVADRAAAGKIALHGRILLAEDGPDNQRLIVMLLTRAGADVTAVENGQLAVEAALAARDVGEPFDLILMDMQMPVLDGYEATRQLRKQGYTNPIVALTAHAMADDRQKCLDAGCDDYATKPIDHQKLLATVAPWAARDQTCYESPDS
jgi:signal transduction histidine kinase